MGGPKKPTPTPSAEEALLVGLDALLELRYAPAAVVIDGRGDVLVFRGRTGPYIEHAPGSVSMSILTMLRPGLVEVVTRGIKDASKRGLATSEPVWLEDDSGGHLLVALDIHTTHEAPSLGERLFCIVFRTLARRGSGQVPTTPLLDARHGIEIASLRAELARATVREQSLRGALKVMQQDTTTLRDEAREAKRQAREKEEALTTALQASLERQALSAATLESIAEGIIVASTDGTILRANPAMAALLGGEREPFIGALLDQTVTLRTLAGELISHAERPATRALLNAQSGTLVPVELVAYLEQKGGARILVAVLARAIEVEGRFIGTVSAYRDMRSIQAAEAAKAEFISLASHQLRTPLSVIALNLELLERSGEADRMSTDSRKALGTMQRAARRMVELMNILLSLARVEAGSLEPSMGVVSLGKLSREILEQLQPFAKERQVRIELRCDKSLKCETDPHFLHMIVQNLLSNAVKYSKPGGLVRCSATIAHGHLLLSVKDDGIGISRADRARVFSRLFRAENALRTHAEGTGLGLYLVRLLVTKLGGEITFTSKLHQGTTFYVKLPLSPEAREGT